MSIDFPKEEEVILENWRKINAFQRQVRMALTLGILAKAANNTDAG